MAKGGLTGAKARINKLEQDKAQLQQIIIHNNHAAQELAQLFENKISELSSTGKAALEQAQQSIEDLQSVNAELRDACEEVQEQRNKAQGDAKTYKWAFWILFTLTAASVAIDSVFYWSYFS